MSGSTSHERKRDRLGRFAKRGKLSSKSTDSQPTTPAEAPPAAAAPPPPPPPLPPAPPAPPSAAEPLTASSSNPQERKRGKRGRFARKSRRSNTQRDTDVDNVGKSGDSRQQQEQQDGPCFPFMSLPPELRLLVYEFLLLSDSCAKIIVPVCTIERLLPLLSARSQAEYNFHHPRNDISSRYRSNSIYAHYASGWNGSPGDPENVLPSLGTSSRDVWRRGLSAWETANIDTAILRTCRTIYHEASDVLYTRNILSLEFTRQYHLECIPGSFFWDTRPLVQHENGLDRDGDAAPVYTLDADTLFGRWRYETRPLFSRATLNRFRHIEIVAALCSGSGQVRSAWPHAVYLQRANWTVELPNIVRGLTRFLGGQEDINRARPLLSLFLWWTQEFAPFFGASDGTIGIDGYSQSKAIQVVECKTAASGEGPELTSHSWMNIREGWAEKLQVGEEQLDQKMLSCWAGNCGRQVMLDADFSPREGIFECLYLSTGRPKWFQKWKMTLAELAKQRSRTQAKGVKQVEVIEVKEKCCSARILP